QAFVIARVVPHGGTQAKYRCIAALHHQWCYGTIPLKATSRFLKLAKQPQNAFIIYEEIRSLHGKYAEYLQANKPIIPDIPALYTMFPFELAFCYD
ncbi:hypothetical protein M422DRAFT_102923, partial [Sphaerobolus stellatus SS14]